MIYTLTLMLWGLILPPSFSLINDVSATLSLDTQATNEPDHVDLSMNDVTSSAESDGGSFSSAETQLETPPVEQTNHGNPQSEHPDASQDQQAKFEAAEMKLQDQEISQNQADTNNAPNEVPAMGSLNQDGKKDSVPEDSLASAAQTKDPLAHQNQPLSPHDNIRVQAPLSGYQETHPPQQQQQQQQQQPVIDGQASLPSSQPPPDTQPAAAVKQDVPPVVRGQTLTSSQIVNADKPDAGASRLSLNQEVPSHDNPQLGQPPQPDHVVLDSVQAADDQRDPGILSPSSSLHQVSGGRAVKPIPAQLKDGGPGAGEAGEEEFPTFDKWSMQYLAEQEKQKIEQEMELVTKPGVVVGQKKLRLNFASAACGAKMMACNPEADNIHYLLNGNPDEYMISPCKAKKWFVVELCEPVQIHKIEIGTMELFSSLPKSVKVLSSQRYPAKDWNPLGTFEIKAERTVQSFSTRVVEDYVKFVRVELVEHHGNEHYCPITFFRVLGLDMASDDEEETDQEALDSQEQVESGKDDRSVSLFEKTKDTVVKLVQKVLYNGDGTESEKKEQQGVEKPADNGTDPTKESKKEEEATSSPCPKAASASQESNTPSIHMPEAGHVPNSIVPTPEEIPIVTKLADTEQLPPEDKEPPLVTKLDTPGGRSLGRDRRKQKCVTPWTSHTKLIYSGMLLPSSTDSSCLKPFVKLTKTSTGKLQQQRSSESPAPDLVTQETISGQATFQNSQAQSGSAHPDQSVNSVKEASVSSTEESKGFSETQSKQDVTSVDVKLSKESQPQESSIATSQSTAFTSAGVSAPTTQILEPSSLSREAVRKDSAASVVTPGLHVTKSRGVNEEGSSNLAESMFLKVSPSPTTRVQDMPENTLPQETATTKLPEDIATPKDVTGGVDSDRPEQSEESQPLAGQRVENTTAKPRPVDLVKVPVMLNSKRDASIIKLNNRIVALELNVSMTKKYLEELSRAFKQQNEDMMSLVNTTINRLNVNIAASEERDLKQQTQIDVLSQQLVNLTAVVSKMQVLIDDMGKELHQRQLIMGMLQAILFVWLMVSTLRGRCKTHQSLADHQFLLDTMPRQPQVRDRRNSDVGVKSEGLTDMPLKRQSSDTNIARSSNDSGNKEILLGTAVVQTSKKKKRKKLKIPLVTTATATEAGDVESKPLAPLESFLSRDFSVQPTGSQTLPFTSGFNLSSFNPTLSSNPHVVKTASEISSKSPHVPHQGPSMFPSTQAVKENIPLIPPRPSPQYIHASTSHSAWPPLFMVKEDEQNTPLTMFHCNPSPPSPFLATRSKSLTPPLGSLENVQLNQHLNSAAGPLSSSPRRLSLDSKESQSSSPEFKLPSYHRSKLRRLGHSLDSDTADIVNLKKGGVTKPGSASTFLPKKPPRITPRQLPFSDFFNEEALLSENRFHFLPENENKDLMSVKSFISRTSVSEAGPQFQAKMAASACQPLPMTRAFQSTALKSPYSPTHPLSPSHSPVCHPTTSPSFHQLGQRQPMVTFVSSTTVSQSQPMGHVLSSSVAHPTLLSYTHPLPSTSIRKDRHQDAALSGHPMTLTLPPQSKAKDQGGQVRSGGKGGTKKSPKSHRRQGSFPLEMNSGSPVSEIEPKKRLNSLDGSHKLAMKPSTSHGKMRKSGSMSLVPWPKSQAIKNSGEFGGERRKGAKC